MGLHPEIRIGRKNILMELTEWGGVLGTRTFDQMPSVLPSGIYDLFVNSGTDLKYVRESTLTKNAIIACVKGRLIRDEIGMIVTSHGLYEEIYGRTS